MEQCPRCSAELNSDADKCNACGLSLGDEFAETATKSDDPDHTPTRLKEKAVSKQILSTSSGAVRFTIGAVLAGRYRILSLLGKGGMGEVYKAEDLELKQTVALKFLPEELSGNEELLERFRGEVRNARKVSHENVCRVFDIGETGGLYYLTMEYIAGDDLSMLLSRIGRFPAEKAAEISRELAMGLNAIHKAGIVHRDLKPANIIIDSNGRARITDFGIAGLEEDVQGFESMVGTPAYMSPEQISGKEVTKKSDIYSFGLLLYEIFTGKQAFEGESIPELLEKKTTASPTIPSEIVTGIDPLAEEVIAKCLEKNPVDRPESAFHVAMMLPGGDPLQVALEAGETPTPEMVAAAPVKGALRPLWAIGLLLGFAGMFSLIMYWSSEYAVNAYTPLKKSPEVLAERARTIISSLGYTEPPIDANFKIIPDPSYRRFAKKQVRSGEWWKRIRSGQPYYYYFRYRQSPAYLLPLGATEPIGANNPPLTKPGMINVKLDLTGRLIEFKAVPPPEISRTSQLEDFNWKKVFREAGLLIENFNETESNWYPTTPFDDNIQWEGTLADFPDIPVRINGSALDGKPVEFKITPSWNEPAGGTQQARTQAGTSVVFYSVLLLLTLIGSILLIRRNLKSGRGDLKGAIKVAVFSFVLLFFGTLLASDSVATLGAKVARFFGHASDSIQSPLVVFLIYLALEPSIRKHWPEALISWNRFLMGDFRNPMIGRDILLGFFLGTFFIILVSGLFYLDLFQNRDWVFEPIALGTESSGSLNGVTTLAGSLLGVPIINSILTCFLTLFILQIFSLIFKKKWLTVLATVLFISISPLLSVLSGEYSIIGAVAEGLAIVIIVLCLVRFGIIATIAWFFINNLVFRSLITFDSASFYFPVTIFAFAFAFSIAIYACYISMAGQSIFGKGFLEDRLSS